jgi:hypothetical protein
LLAGYLQRFARPIDLKHAEAVCADDWHRYQALRTQVLVLMKEADAVASRLRGRIIYSDS